ncbi:YqiA/YcfP family alpha/beta fold hydrolase [Aliagarivorans marinus]|uniref:YqiA/YcfP family alpha/beta fold hydrolase n=1 Tax=Aliagarivorans marinus TaxID=561965 RepID=UPI00040CF993|nr:YqiA/YcfP family alpha/beta fold hydrolase [Aliagarivorans marinus]
MSASPVLLYLHGFNSSPQSLKAEQMRTLVAQREGIEWLCPQLACHPMDAWRQIEQLVRAHQGRPLGVIGSSLGGFLATRVAEHFGARAVLINPAVQPYNLLKDYLGPQLNPYTQQHYQLEPQHIDELRALEVAELSCASRLWVLLQTDDEILDYRLAEREYARARLTIEQGGDHSFQGFQRYCPDILSFLFD